MSLFRVSTPFNIELEFTVAPFHKRLIAWLVDLLLLFIYAYLMLFFVYGSIMEAFEYGGIWQHKAEVVLVIFTVVLPVMMYHLIFEVFNHGRSPGKIVLGLKVMNKEGAAPSLSQYLLRWILCFPNYFSLLIIFAYQPAILIYVMMILGVAGIPDVIAIAVSKYGQRLGDLAADTLLVDTQVKSTITETIFMDLDEETVYEPVYPEVLRLTDRDLNGIRNLLSVKNKRYSEDYILRVSYKIEEVLGVKMNGSPELFLSTLMKDYNYLTQRSTS